MVFLFGLFVLVAAGAPPFGGHGADYFVSAEFKGRAGGLGEAFYALFHKLAGTIGVGIVGWVAVVAGFSLATGMTARRLGHRTKRAAGAVRDGAERGMTLVKNRDAPKIRRSTSSRAAPPQDGKAPAGRQRRL